MLINAFKTAGADKVIGAYIISFFAFALLICIWEPNIGSYLDGLWFCFASATSIGYGDLVAVTFPGRLVIVILTVYSIAVIAIFTAVITGFFMDLARIRASDSVQAFLVDLEHLPEMSKEELEKLSQKVKDFQKKK